MSPSSLVQAAEDFVQKQRSRSEGLAERPYERDGAHVTVGESRPLAENFVPSGSTVPAATPADSDR
jgi:hypothetical protein